MVLRSLPSVDALLRTDFARKLRDQVGALKLTGLARLAIENLRRDVLKSDSDKTALSPHDNGLQKQLLHRAEEKLKSLHDAHLNARLRRVINATGVVLHTNLGAPLCPTLRYKQSPTPAVIALWSTTSARDSADIEAVW